MESLRPWLLPPRLVPEEVLVPGQPMPDAGPELVRIDVAFGDGTRVGNSDLWPRWTHDEPTRPVLVYKMPEEAIVDWIKLPGVAIGSDGMPMVPDEGLVWDTPYEELPNTHPRFSGSFAKVLRLARENDVPLMQAVSMTSYNYARPLGEMGLKAMQVRGRMQEGMVADITIFDPETVTDNATYEQGTLPSSGIPHLIVNGIVVMKDSEPLKRFEAGQAIRFEPLEEGRFEPLSIESWTGEYYVAPIDFGGGVPGSQPSKSGTSYPMPHLH